MKWSTLVAVKNGMNSQQKVRSSYEDEATVRLLSKDLIFFFNAGLIFATTIACFAAAYIDIVKHF